MAIRKRKRCSKCGERFYPKPYQRKCEKCHTAAFWNSSIIERLITHLRGIKYRGQLEQTNLIEVIELIKKQVRLSGFIVRDVSVKGEKSRYETSKTLELDLSHLYPNSKGGLLCASNLVIAPRSINRANGNKVFPVGQYDTSGGLVGWDDVKQWVEANHDLKAIVREYNLTPKTKPKSVFTGEQWTLDHVLLNEADRLKLRVMQGGMCGWCDLLEGKLDTVTEQELQQRSMVEQVSLELCNEYPCLSYDEIEQVILLANADKQQAINELDDLMEVRYPRVPDCSCITEEVPWCFGECNPAVVIRDDSAVWADEPPW